MQKDYCDRCGAEIHRPYAELYGNLTREEVKKNRSIFVSTHYALCEFCASMVYALLTSTNPKC